MSTNAVVFIKNENGRFTGTEIVNDGYIDVSDERGRCRGFGAGYILGKYWQDKEEIEKLVKGNMIRNLGKSIEETEFYETRQTGLDNLTLAEVKNLGYSYIYIFGKSEVEWSVMCTNYERTQNMFFNLDSFLNYNDPERFYDHESFWK